MTAVLPMRKRRLERLEQIYRESPLLFVTFCTYERRKLLANDIIHQSFIQFGTQAREHGNFFGHYVIMPDHVHFFVAMENPHELSGLMKSLKNSLSKTLRNLGHAAPHWQKDFFDHVLRSDSSYDEKWDYVKANPARAGFVSKAEEWKFCGEMVPLEFD
jgi:putative transposase